jgi:hypothetical protein
MWARRSRQLHIHIRLLTQRGREADLRGVVSSYSARGCASHQSPLKERRALNSPIHCSLILAKKKLQAL